MSTFKFQTQTKELLHLMIHSVYSHKEIFLRELISNASDAIDKLKFEGKKNPALSEGKELGIHLHPDSKANTLTITDMGIGMSEAELKENIGTIAHSGTKKFVELQKEAKNNMELIGQFGIGFYSGFMVANKIEVHTKKAGEEKAYLWTSDGSDSYSIEEKAKDSFGTTITLHLKSKEENDQDFTDTFTLQELVKKYSDFIAYPVTMMVENEGKVEKQTLNSQKPLWQRNPSEISKEEYNEFYKHISHDWTDPLKTIHFKGEGTFEFNALMYIPSMTPFNFYYKDYDFGLSLYVKRVFIMDHCKTVIPDYLRFVRGLVDSADLNLNVSREILQQDKQLVQIKKSLVNKIFASLKELLQSDRENYIKFYQNFGKVLKEGIPNDPANKEKIQDLVLYHSTNGEALCTLKEYTDRMKAGQKEIYYLTGEDLSKIKNSPHLEQLKAEGYEVLLLPDAMDEWLIDHVSQYKDFKFKSAAKGDLNLENKKVSPEQETKFKPLTEKMKSFLGDIVKDVKVSSRLKESPVCLVSGEQDPSAQLEKLIAAHSGQQPKTKRILEINPEHPIFDKLLQAKEENQKEWTDLLYNQALLLEGSTLPDPMKFSQSINKLLLNL